MNEPKKEVGETHKTNRNGKKEHDCWYWFGLDHISQRQKLGYKRRVFFPRIISEDKWHN